METACHAAPLCRGTSRTDAQKLVCHRSVFGPGSGNILPRAWGSTGHPYPAQIHLGNGIPGLRTSETWDSDPLTFQNACGLGICAITIFFCVETGFREHFGKLLVSCQSPLWRIQGPPRKVFYGDPTFVCPRKKILYTMVQRATWTPY